MGARIESRQLPGIGVCQEIATKSGRRVAVVIRRTGERELVLSDPEDPDAARERIPLTDAEANALAEILGAPTVVAQLAGLQEQAEGLLTEQIPVAAGSRYDGRPLGDTKARTRTGASIVAVLRRGEVAPSPGPEFALQGGDLVVVVGTRDGIDGVAAILAGAFDPA